MFIYNSSTIILIVLIYVDDIIITGNSTHLITKLIKFLTVKRILRYLACTINHGICFNATPNTTLTAFTDADYASSPDDRRSIGGLCVYLGDNLVSWSCSK
ncbi:hypothetical protein UlMin_041865 [Ulmus minor]